MWFVHCPGVALEPVYSLAAATPLPKAPPNILASASLLFILEELAQDNLCLSDSAGAGPLCNIHGAAFRSRRHPYKLGIKAASGNDYNFDLELKWPWTRIGARCLHAALASVRELTLPTNRGEEPWKFFTAI